MDGTMTASMDCMAERFAPAPENERRLRDAFGSFATGVTVVTTCTPAGPVGMTANSFSSVSLEPALVLWCIGKQSDRFEAFSPADRYAIHVLSADQQDLSNGFARDSRYFDRIAWHEGADRIPTLDGCLSRFDCKKVAHHDAGDHVIIVGQVIGVETRLGTPLLFASGAYGGLHPAP